MSGNGVFRGGRAPRCSINFAPRARALQPRSPRRSLQGSAKQATTVRRSARLPTRGRVSCLPGKLRARLPSWPKPCGRASSAIARPASCRRLAALPRTKRCQAGDARLSPDEPLQASLVHPEAAAAGAPLAPAAALLPACRDLRSAGAPSETPHRRLLNAPSHRENQLTLIFCLAVLHSSVGNSSLAAGCSAARRRSLLRRGCCRGRWQGGGGFGRRLFCLAPPPAA